MFADDILLFGEATLTHINCVMDYMQVFCNATRQKVSNEKTRIYFSKKTPYHAKTDIISYFGFVRTDNLGLYLGMPLIHDKQVKKDFSRVLDRVNSKLSGWKANCLSMARRITLAKSVISSIPYYSMQSTHIPRSVYADIEKLQRNFIWGHPKGGRRLHTIRWDVMCRDKNCEGLGIKRLAKMNDAFIMKIGWKIKTNLDNICSQVLIGKYGRGKDLRREISVKDGDSCLWK